MMAAAGSHHITTRRGRPSHDESDDTVLSVQEISDDAPLVWKVPQFQDEGVATSAPSKAGKEDSTKQGAGLAKILFLDGVRGIAAILVVTQHSGYMGDVNLGICAVDIFFVLSSFLLTMLFYKKSLQLLTQKASLRKWGYTLADYFSKRFLRVYPLFALVAILLWILPYEYKKQYFLVSKPDHYDIIKVLTFEFPYRYHVFWTLPLEITYYFMIPVFVVTTIALGRGWWIPFIPLYIWIVNNGLNVFRGDHQPLAPHLPTFVSGSLAAVIFIKLDDAIKRNSFEFSKWQTVTIRAVEMLIFCLLMSVCYRSLLFHWVHENPAHENNGARFISLHVTSLFVIEMITPSVLSTVLEWIVFRYWGKIGFSVYLLHSFVIYTNPVRHQGNYYDKLFGQFILIFMLSTMSYHLIEYPSQLLAQRITEALAQRERSTAVPVVKYMPVPKAHDLATAA
uniref:Acyltransferase 3 domain-containing protein n=1 Tax=Globisporangium ultimum (strain ATCC 200006 / CBS 805.95 / DAOM BR144) TaxID=431595 RepID=K3WMB5_GLOUD